MSAGLFHSMMQRATAAASVAFPSAGELMTGYSAPAGYQAGMSVYPNFSAAGGTGYGTNAAWKVFDNGNMADDYATNGASISVGVGSGYMIVAKFPSGRIFKNFDLYAATDSSNNKYHPIGFKMIGSNNGSTWTDLTSVYDLTGSPWGTIQKRTFTGSNSSSYTYYGIYAYIGGYSTGNGGNNCTSDGSWLMRQIVFQP